MLDSFEKVYQHYTDRYPQVENPALDEVAEVAELLIICPCEKGYRVPINGYPSQSSIEGLAVVCPHCGRSIQEWVALFWHSGGVFNAGYDKRLR